jgi:hypothetical protein
MKCLCVVACLALLSASALAQQQTRVVGLLALPEVFGNGPCDRFTPQDVPLYGAPESARIVGVIRVDEGWTASGDGGCEGLRVGVHMTGTTTSDPLPTKEYGYEEPGAIVLARRSGWSLIRLATGSAWVRSSSRDRFHPLEQLLLDGLTYLTEEWDGRLAPSAGTPGRLARVEARSSQSSVHVIRSQQLRGELWFDLEVTTSPCGEDPNVKTLDRGWVRAHSASGEPVIWFSSRGC